MSLIPTAWRPVLEVLVGVMTAGCVVPYIRDILRGKTRPQRMSWLTFAALSAAATVAQFTDTGATSAVFLTAGATVGFATVFVLSIWHGVGGTSVTDIAALVGLGLVLVIWTQTDNTLLIIGLIIAAEIPATAATVVKSLKLPATETPSTWVIDGSAGILAIVAAESMSFDLVGYPTFHTLANFSVVAAIAVGTHRAATTRGR